MSAAPSPLYFAERLTEHFGGAKIYLKREELNHTGAHKINNCMGQILLAMRMGKTRIIAETGAGQHGVATATVCARFGLPCVVYMGAVDVERQKPNVFRMNLLGAEVRPVTSGRGDPEGRHERGPARLGHQRRRHLLPDRHGRRPAPLSGHGPRLPGGDRHARPAQQILEMEGRLPDAVVACVGGGSNAIGLFHPFLNDESVKIYRGRGGRRRHGHRPPRRGHQRRPPGRPARQQDLPAAGRRGPDPRGPLDLRRPRLSRHRARALLAARRRPRHAT